MGCWVETCGITQLPIHDGDRTKYLILVKVDSYRGNQHGGFCYPSTHYAMLGPPVSGTYNDYGSIEPDKKQRPSVAITHKWLNRSGIAGNLSKILERIERGEEAVTTSRGPEVDLTLNKSPIGRVLILESVWNAITEMKLENMFLMPSSIEPLKTDARKWIAEVQGQYKKFSKLEPEQCSREGFRYDLGMDIHFAENRFYQSFMYGDSGVGLRPWTSLIHRDLIDEKDIPEDLLDELCECIFVHRFLARTRKFLSPQSGKGSQDSNLDDAIDLAKLTIKLAEEKRRRLDE